METRANHVLIGMFTLMVILSAILFALWAAKYSSDKSWTEYDVVFHEAVTGLTVGSVVQYNGIAVGDVRKLSLDVKDPNKVIARIRVGAETPVKVDTKAKLAFVGLTGVAQIQFSGGTANSPRLVTDADHGVPVINAEESAFAKLINSTTDITVTAADMLLRINKMLSEENVQHISNTLANLDGVTGAVAGEKKNIAELIADARSAAAKLDQTLDNTNNVVTKLDQNLVTQIPNLVTKIDRTLVQLEALSRNANGMVAENREAISSFGNQGLTQVGPTITELRGLLRQLNRVSSRLEENPAAFILGRGKPEEFEP